MNLVVIKITRNLLMLETLADDSNGSNGTLAEEHISAEDKTSMVNPNTLEMFSFAILLEIKTANAVMSPILNTGMASIEYLSISLTTHTPNDLPILTMVIFHSYANVYQRVNMWRCPRCP